MDAKKELRKEKNRIAKQQERHRKIEAKEVVDLADKRRRVIKNICDGKLVRSDLKILGITIDMIKCDHQLIHPEILDQLLHPPAIEEIKDKQPQVLDAVHPTEQSKKRIKITVKRTQPPFTMDTISQIFDEILSRGEKSERTIAEYKRRIKYIMDAVGCSDTDFIKCINQPCQVITALKTKHPKAYKDDISPIIVLSNNSTLFNQLVSPEIINIYRQEMTTAIKESEKKQSDVANNGKCIPLEDIVKLRSQLAQNNPFTQKHLLISLYTYIPSIRDDFGNVQLIFDDIEPPDTNGNYYYPRNGRFILNKYKTIGKYGVLDIMFPKQLCDIIAESLNKNPRKYLITIDNNKSQDTLYGKGSGKLSNLISTSINISINDLRHSLETYVHMNRHMFTHDEIKLIDFIMGHSASMALSYVRTGELDPLQQPNNMYIPPPFDKTTETSLLQSVCDKIGGNIK